MRGRRRAGAGWNSLVSAVFAAGCTEACPPGYGHQQDQCVKRTTAPLVHPCSALPSTKPDPGGGPSTYARVDVPAGSCFWMSQLEVTVGEYRPWATAVSEVTDAGGVSWDQQVCRWKERPSLPWLDQRDACTAMIPSLDTGAFATTKPIRCVDFCDADAFCRAQGNRLCWGLGSSAVQGPRVVPREWVIACTNSFATPYPWGTSLDVDGMRNDCNVSDEGKCYECSPYEAGRRQRCSTERGGIADLLGNVAEWAWACTFVARDAGGGPRGCAIHGGGFTQPLRSCYEDESAPNDTRRIDLGFRCCADLTSDETRRIGMALQPEAGSAVTSP